MTIGIAAVGPNAGQAVRCGLAAAEVLGCGAIGGFAVCSILNEAGEHWQASCQSGGVEALGGAEEYASARIAAVISSGPHRPEPLSQFLAGSSGVGLVTGHRLPNRIGAAGRPVNIAVLQRMADGLSPAKAVQTEIDANAELDFGLVAISADGRIGFGNSERVARRTDLGSATRFENGRGFALLCNSIHAAVGIPFDQVVGDIVWACLTGTETAHFIAELSGPVPLQPALEDRIELDERNRVVRICAAEPRVTGDSPRTTVIYSRASVWRDDRHLGSCASEVFARVEAGRAAPAPASERRFVVARGAS